jgi:hypothetical protein
VKQFSFPLEGALKIRRTQLEIERARTETLARAVTDLDRAGALLQNAKMESKTWISQTKPLDSSMISTVPEFDQFTRRQIAKVQLRKNEVLAKLTVQKSKAVEANQRVKLIERLREKRLAEWVSSMQKEQETFAADAHLARWTAHALE